ncbi:MAG: hypothetical protein E7632_02335 [Ruminococcaceae bacterium]|nr:hypothetical protein [Oscillospiraceae bacterium]
MYKRLLAILPVILLTVFVAGRLEQSYTEPQIAEDAPIRAAAVLTEAFTDAAEAVTAGLAEETTAAPPETETVPETAPPETIPVPETTAAPETIAVPETTAAPVTTAPPVTTAVPVTTMPPRVVTTAAETEPQTVTVYWVPNGEVWHLKSDCSTLSRSKTILSGTIEGAMDAGKDRVCKRCGG